MNWTLNLIKENILSFIFPVNCICCGVEGDWLCKDCRKLIKFFKHQVCHACKAPTKKGEFCLNCNDKYQLDGITVIADYNEESVENLIKSFKYQGQKGISNVLAELLIQGIRKYRLPRSQNAILVPIPIHRSKKAERGFNQSEELARAVSDRLNLSMRTSLVKIRSTKSQAGLSKKEREQNIKDCFIWKGQSLKGKTIILIDDVVSTATTLNEAARELKKFNPKKIWAICFARG